MTSTVSAQSPQSISNKYMPPEKRNTIYPNSLGFAHLVANWRKSSLTILFPQHFYGCQATIPVHKSQISHKGWADGGPYLTTEGKAQCNVKAVINLRESSWWTCVAGSSPQQEVGICWGATSDHTSLVSGKTWCMSELLTEGSMRSLFRHWRYWHLILAYSSTSEKKNSQPLLLLTEML